MLKRRIRMSMKAMVAMSGGVDSSVCAYLMQHAGFDCVGSMMKMHDHQSENDVKDAMRVAEKLGIPFYLMNAEELFAEKVIGQFISCYESGATPNPCIECNKFLKFDRFAQQARVFGCDTIATGHYARVEKDGKSGRYLLKKALDESKDQSYVLACLSQEQLSHAVFPLGQLTKQQAREIAETQGFVNARKHDSQDICFIPDGDYVAFMERYTGKHYAPGKFLDLNGKEIGAHRGAVCYTLGQRKGLGLAMGEPVYVCAKDMDANTVTVGPNEALFARTLIADEWNWIPFPALRAPMKVTARARYNQKEQPATVYPMENGWAKVTFDAPQRAMTPGQAVVLYDGETVVGGGTIRGIEK